MYLKFNSNFVFSVILFSGFITFFLLYLYIVMYSKVYLIDYEVFNLNGVNVKMSILLDWMSTSFMSFVLFISFIIVLYSISYMGSDKNLSFFIILVFSFVLSMMLLIISPNLISILLGWDGLGLISYCLVIYYQNVKSYNAGMVTAMTNRIGDVMILISIAWMMNFGSWDYIIYYNYNMNLYFIIGSFIVVAAMTKSAQIPFSSWLPAAMAAPTPVSALVHSSTLVTAGVYLLIRFNEIFNFFILKWILLILSVLTMFMSGLGAIFEYDLKKIIALSTLSQLGLMISTLCMGMYKFAFFHLLTHALFKSLLFMCAGYIIHGMNDCQDIRFMGGIIHQSPMLGCYFNISNLSLCGMPFLAGFYSKDLILEKIFMNTGNYFILFLYFVATFFTVVYTFRLIYMSMINPLKLNSYYCLNDNDFIMLGFMMFMQMWVIIGGCLLTWTLFMDVNIFLPLNLKLFTLIICVIGGVSGYLKENFIIFIKSHFMWLNNVLGEMWFLPYISTYMINYGALNIGYLYNYYVDLGWAEKISGQGLFNILMFSNNNISYIMNKNVLLFMYMIFLFVLMLILICLNS
uniref:NADH-ubiquinone oxidoreductase chain 5 n=1 Tax=Paracaecilius japanus TaxID=297965 RepID=A0A8K1ZG46_9NEOP|nr:NADH dehydrogenase subunit 5 [Paracaecilius japanus]